MRHERELSVAYVLLVFAGLFGAHKFYLNRPVMGVIYVFTGGIFFLGVIVDLFTLASQVERCNRDLALEAGARFPSSIPPQTALRREGLAEAARRIERFSQRLDNLETLIYARKRF
jgi:hypothetical protein